MIINHATPHPLLPEPHGSRSRTALPAPPRCLVVTAERRQRDSIRLAAATHAGFACDTAATVAEIDRLAAGEQELVFIDLAGLVGPLRRRAIRLAAARSRRQASLVVCGRERDDERLAERLGVGLFLPGVCIATAVNCVLAEFTRPGSPPPGCAEC